MNKGYAKLFYKLSIILVFILALTIYCEKKLSELPTTYSLKKENLEKYLDSIEVLILGSSETLYAINPEYLSLFSYNLADQSQSLFYDKELSMKYIDRIPKLKYVIISITYFSLWYELYNSIENWRDYFYYRIWQIPTNNIRFMNSNTLSFITLFGIEFTQQALLRNFHISTGTENLEPNGWYKNTERLNSENADTSSISELFRQNSAMADSVFPNQIIYLKTLLDAIRSRNANPIFISTPVHNSYLKRIDAAKKEINMRLIEELCRKYKCRYFDFSNDDRFVSGDFADTDHLNEIGSEKFTRIINLVLNSLKQ